MLCFDDLVLDCKDSNGRGRNESLLCADADRQVVDKRLNQTYQRILSRLAGKNKASLIEAQRAWVRFKLADCEDEAGYEETVANWRDVSVVSCETEHTKQRLQTLERRYRVKLSYSRQRPNPGFAKMPAKPAQLYVGRLETGSSDRFDV
jgi:uncharacterized protein YecT (DUF1311 family)